MVATATQKELLYGALTHVIIGAAMEVHKILGPGFLESVYEEALAHEFDAKGLNYERQAPLSVRYKTITAGKFIADFVVESKVLVELKAIKLLTRVDEAQILNYMKATGIRVGLLLNFGAPSLEHWRRVL
ncbi:MAG: GxxExxY protein [Chloroflexi bacterium]|nr:GxxExxY protein [Chloroflexota bacterium]MCL5274967.1 GxxExxY protein [Chloroflexota bacterium]